MISKVSLPAMTNFIAPATTPAAPLHQNARLVGATHSAPVRSTVNDAAVTAAPKLTNKSGFRSAATSSQTPLDFLGIKQKNAGSRLRDNIGGVKRPVPAILDSMGGPLDLPKPSVPIGSKAAPLRGVFGQDMNSPMEKLFREIGGYVATPTVPQLRSTPAAQHGVQLHDAVNHRLQNSTDVLLSGIAPLQGTPRELAVKDMLNNTQPIAGTRSELAMKDMLNGIEPVQQTAASLLNGIEPVRQSVTSVLNSIGPMKPTTTSLLDGVRDSWKQRLLPTDKTSCVRTCVARRRWNSFATCRHSHRLAITALPTTRSRCRRPLQRRIRPSLA
jgi:hypothetical protein